MISKERLDNFPTQLVLTLIWLTAGTVASFIFRESLLWVGLISVYAIVVSHWSAHLAWKAERESHTT